jgi:hypothetical protein
MRLEVRPGSAVIPQTAELLVERRVGRGRVVVTAMRLSERALVRWHGFDNFFNACILRRPPRHYRIDPTDLTVQLDWADSDLEIEDSSLATAVRYFARDGTNTGSWRHSTTTDTASDALQDRFERRPRATSPFASAGVAAWNSAGEVVETSRVVLRSSAGIDIPSASLVARILAAYLVVVVPLNYLLFRYLGRIEWAWAAAPLVALVFAAIVTVVTGLDVGLARSQTEVAVLETQAGHGRGHLTRFVALYSSLATTCSLEFDRPDALAQPLATYAGTVRPGTLDRSSVRLRRRSTAVLEGILVPSNARRMVQSEEMVELGGTIELRRSAADGLRVVNSTPFDLVDVVVLRRTDMGDDVRSIEEASLGTLSRGASRILEFTMNAAPSAVRRSVRRRTETGETQKDSLHLERLKQLAMSAESLLPHEIRLVGRIDGRFPGLRVRPAAGQIRGATLVVAHLEYGGFAAPRPDTNHWNDTVRDRREEMPWENFPEESATVDD